MGQGVGCRGRGQGAGGTGVPPVQENTTKNNAPDSAPAFSQFEKTMFVSMNIIGIVSLASLEEQSQRVGYMYGEAEALVS